jgi:hypothetical protein
VSVYLSPEVAWGHAGATGAVCAACTSCAHQDEAAAASPTVTATASSRFARARKGRIKPIILVAGGTGFAPIKGIVKTRALPPLRRWPQDLRACCPPRVPQSC